MGETFLNFMRRTASCDRYDLYKAITEEFSHVPYLKSRWDSFWESHVDSDPDCFVGRAAIALAHRTGHLTTMIYKEWLKSLS